MKTIGIIAEYNPFHNGHLYHINKIKELYPNSIIVLVLNGYFTQRGDVSVLIKEDKVNISLENNVDIVLEHPLLYSLNSADIFAESAVLMLNEFKVDKIIFGSESNDINLLYKEAYNIIEKEKTINFKELNKTGKSYASIINSNLSSPNDILGVSYIKAAIKNSLDIKFETIKRTNSYHDTESVSNIVSATNIRRKFKENKEISKYTNYNNNLININDELLFNIIKYKIINDGKLNTYRFVDEGIDNKLKEEIINSDNLTELINNVKSKRFTHNKLTRMIISILLSVDKNYKFNGIEYIKILGFNNKGRQHLNIIKKDNDMLIDRKIPNTYYGETLEIEVSLIYDILTNNNTYSYEKLNKPIIKVD